MTGKNSTIEQIKAQISFVDDQKQLAVSLQGTWQHAPLSANIIDQQSSGNLTPQKLNIKI